MSEKNRMFVQLYPLPEPSNSQKDKNLNKMKKLILSLILSAAAVFPATAQPAALRADTAAADSAAAISPASQEYIEQIVDRKLQNYQNEHDYSERDIPDNAVAITSVVSVFITLIAIAIAIVAGVVLRNRNKYRLVEKAIETGYQIPEYVFRDSPENSPGNSRRALRNAVTLLAVGLGCMICFLFAGSMEMVGLLSILVLLGGGRLVIAILEIKEEKARQEAAASNPGKNADED